jgi:hypothetical protein
MTKLRELATSLRTKNADPFVTTCDVFIRERRDYERIRDSGILSPARIASIYAMPEEAVLGIYFLDEMQAIKVSFFKVANGKYIASGDLDDMDALGAQQHVPIAELDVPDGKAQESPA